MDEIGNACFKPDDTCTYEEIYLMLIKLNQIIHSDIVEGSKE